jgi:hypothetical protein
MNKLYFLSLLFVATFFKSNAQVCFMLHTDYIAGTNPSEMLTEDFNNDAKKDIVVINNGDNNVYVWLGDGLGNFAAPGIYATVMGPMTMAAADFNGDAFKDIVYFSNMGGTINILLNDGFGGFTTGTSFSGVSFPQDIGAGDFNSDGFMDIVTPNYSTGNISVFLGDGTGSFGPNTNFAAGTNPQAVVVVDLNGDTKADVVTGNYGSNNISVLIGNGTGGFAPRVNYAASTAPGAVISNDFDGDGDMDIAVGHMNVNNISILLNNGTGVLAAATNYNCGSNNISSMATGDFNADGKVDIAVPTDYLNTANIILGNGSGAFGAFQSFPTDFGPREICAADFNGDGRTDLATASFNSNSMSVLLNNAVVPVVHATASDTSVCANSMLTLIGTVSAGTATYTWQPNLQPGVPVDNTPFQVMGPMQTTFTVTGTTTDGCSDTDTLTITAVFPPNIYGNAPSPVCSGQSVMFSQGSSDPNVTLSWSDGVQIGVPYFPATTHTYTLTGTGLTGCVTNITTTVGVTPSPVAVIASGSPVCQNDPYILSSAGSSGGNNYQWTGPNVPVAAGTTPNNPSTNVTAPGTYTLQLLSTTSGCADTATATISFVPAPNVGASADHTIICAGTPVIFTGSGANSYVWSGGVTNGVPHAVNGTQTYTVTGMDLNGCDATATVNVTVNIPPAPEICRITVDSLSQNNVIYWDKTLYPMADSFYVYRDLANNAYAVIGKVHHDSLSQFTDTLRTLYPANGDPNVSSWRYKIAIKDTCGTMGPLGLYHQSIFMQNTGGNFSWSEYKIEGQGTPVSGLNNYVFKRDNTSSGNYIVIQVLSASSTSYTDGSFSSFPTGTWRTETTWSNSCTSSMRINGSNDMIFGAINTSRSNIKSPSSIGIKELKNELNVSVYPVPASTSLTVELGTAPGETSIEMVNTLGQSVYSAKTQQVKNTIDCTGMETGVYFITVRSLKGQSIRKVVIQ